MDLQDESFWDGDNWLAFHSSIKVNLISSTIVSAICFTLFATLFAYLCWTETLWVKRFFRANHTMLVPLREEGTAPSNSVPAGGAGSANSILPLSPGMEVDPFSTPFSSTAAAFTASPSSMATQTRYRALSLLACSALFAPPSLREWGRVEEAIPPRCRAQPPPAVFSSLPHSSGTSAAAAAAMKSPLLSWTSNSFSPQRRTKAPATESAPSSASPCSTVEENPNEQNENKEGKKEGEDAEREENGKGRGPCTFASPSSTLTRAWSSALGEYPFELEGPFSREYADPQSVLYIFTLKFFASLMLFNMFFIMGIAGLELKSGMDKQKRERGAAQGNLTCPSNLIHCALNNGTLNTSDYAAFRITAQDIPRKSWMWWLVGVFNCGFCVVTILLTVYFVRTVSRYIDEVMARQIEHALGYRLVCIRSAKQKHMASVDCFRQKFLHESVYFRDNSNSPRWHSFLEWFHPDYIWDLICRRSCLLSRSDTVMWEPNKIKRVVITQQPPAGMIATMRKERRYVKKLQDAVVVERERALKDAQKAQYFDGNEEDGGNPACTLEIRESEAEEGGNRPPEAPPRCSKVHSRFCCSQKKCVNCYKGMLFVIGQKLNQYVLETIAQKAALAGFIEFEDSRSAFEFINLFRARFGTFTSSALADIAGPHQGVLLENLQVRKLSAIFRHLLVTLLFSLLVTCYAIPIAIISSLENIASILGVHDEFVRVYTAYVPGWLIQLINSYLPVAMLALFNILLPVIIRCIVKRMKLLNQRHFEARCLHLQTLFMVLSGVIFQSALQGGLKKFAAVRASSREDFATILFLDCVVPKSNGYFYAKVLYAIGLSLWVDAIDPLLFLRVLFTRGYTRTQAAYNEIFTRQKPNYVDWYSFDLTTLAVGMLFHMAVPLLTPLVLLYFLLRYLLQRARFFDQHRTEVPVERDCTNFEITAWVVRATMMLYVLSEGGGLVVLYVKAHVGGLVLSCLTLSASVGLTVYVILASCRWKVSLQRIHDLQKDLAAASARKTSPQAEDHPDELVRQITSMEADPTTKIGGSPQPAEPLRTPAAAAADDDKEEEATVRNVESRITWDSPPALSGFKNQFHCRGGSTGSHLSQDNPTSALMNFGVGEVCPECEIQLKKILCRGYGCIPRYRNSCLYLPMHLRLRIIEVEAEIEKILTAEYDVVQYWNGPKSSVKKTAQDGV